MRGIGLLICLGLAAAPAVAADDWPEFRGPTQQGHASATGLPVTWSETQNVKWKTAIPGEGWSSPVILGNQVWMTTALNGGRSLRAVCVDKDSGRVVHDVEVFTVEKPKPKNSFNSYASPTPALEAGRVYVTFGTDGTACLDAATGRVLWKNEELKLDHKEGAGSSPILYKNYLILHCDGTDVQYVAALDKHTGKLAWRRDRDTDFGNKPPDIRKAYNIPLLVNHGGRDQIVSVGAFRVFGYDPNDGRQLWHCDIPGFSNVPRPVYDPARGVVYVCTGYMRPELWAARLGSEGDVAGSVLWKFSQGVPAKPSLLLIGGLLYMVHDNGVARCLEAATGKQVWQERLEGTYTASPVYAGGLVYFFSEQGGTTVVKPGRKCEVVSENQLDGRFMASPAVSGKAMFLRTDKHLYRVEN